MSTQDLTIESATSGSHRSKPRTLRQRIMQRLIRHATSGQITITFRDGTSWRHTGSSPGPEAALQLHRDSAVTRLVLGGDIGFAQSYIDGDWDSPDLYALLAFGAANVEPLDGTFSASLFNACVNRIQHAFRANTRKGSRRNIAFHYDLGNAFYGQWLDPTMTYSAALFEQKDGDLAEAQRAKYHRLAKAVGLEQGSRVLEIGCGWGGFAGVAAGDYGSDLVGLTLSTEQRDFARDRMDRAGFSSQADIRLQDYRDVTGLFDAVVSIEMFEALGAENWRTYFEKVRSVLRPGGKAGIQVITIDEGRFEAYRNRPDFIQKYIFPGGMLPSPERFERAAARAGFRIDDCFFFGDSYAETLRRWDTKFEARWPEIAALGFDDRFRRMWRYYLAYCEAGFRSGTINVAQYILTRP